MPAPLSVDLRKRAVMAYLEGELSVEVTAAQFQIGPATLRRWLRQFRQTGELAALPHNGGPDPMLRDEHLKRLRELVKAQPDLTRDEYGEELAKHTGLVASVATIGRALSKLGFTRKKRRSSPRNSSRSGRVRYATGFARGKAPWKFIVSSS